MSYASVGVDGDTLVSVRTARVTTEVLGYTYCRKHGGRVRGGNDNLVRHTVEVNPVIVDGTALTAEGSKQSGQNRHASNQFEASREGEGRWPLRRR